MDVITTHINADFDCLGAMTAALKLYPGALLRVTGGYRGWTSVVGGPSLAADLLLAF